MLTVSEDARAAIMQFYLATGLGCASKLVKPFPKPSSLFAYYDHTLLSRGFPEMLTLNSVDAAGHGCMVRPPDEEHRPAPPSELSHNGRESPSTSRLGSGCTSKLSAKAAGWRAPRPQTPCLTPGGRVEHAHGVATSRAARESLKAGTQAIERARGPLRRRDPAEAVEVWRGLVSGLWSLVDHFDTDGRRYLVAHRNDATTPDPRALTERERQVLAYAETSDSPTNSSRTSSASRPAPSGST